MRLLSNANIIHLVTFLAKTNKAGNGGSGVTESNMSNDSGSVGHQFDHVSLAILTEVYHRHENLQSSDHAVSPLRKFGFLLIEGFKLAPDSKKVSGLGVAKLGIKKSFNFTLLVRVLDHVGTGQSKAEQEANG